MNLNLILSLIIGVTMLSGCNHDNDPVMICSPGIKGQWEFLGLAGETISAIAINRTDPRIIFAGSMYDFTEGVLAKLFRSRDCGETWDTLMIADRDFHDIVFDPANSNVIYCSSWGVLKSVDGGDTWIEVSAGYFPEGESVVSLALDPVHPGFVYAGSGVFTAGNVWKSSDAGQSWSSISNIPKLQHPITGLGFSPDGGILYAASAEGDVLKTTNGGVTWDTTATIPAESFLQHMFIDDAGRVFLAIKTSGLLFSDNQGESWHLLNRNLVISFSWTISVRSPDGMLITSGSYANQGPGIYKMGSDSIWQKFGIDSVSTGYVDPKPTFSSDYGYLYYGLNGLYRYRFP